MTAVSGNYYSNGNVYMMPTKEDAEKGFLIASAASGAIMATLPYFSKPFTNQMKNEVKNNKQYKDAFINSYATSGLLENDVKIVNMKFSSSDLEKIGTSLENEIHQKDIKAGLNACYVPDFKEIRLNLDKAAISGFHEAGHSLNHLQSKVGRFLQKLRGPGYVIAGLMGSVALFSKKKPKEDENGVMDFIKSHCGEIAFASLLPTVAEEAMASHKGIKLAEAGGLNKDAIKNLKKFYGKALLSYIGYAVATGLSVFTARKIMDYYTSPKKIEINL